MNDLAGQEDETRERLAMLSEFLRNQSAFAGDSLSWAADCIQSFLDGNEQTLDHAFGLKSSKRGPKPMESGAHDDWVVAAWCEVRSATPIGRDKPDTKTLAGIGRKYGLGGRSPEDADDHGIASELQRILDRYQPIITKQLSDELTARLNEKEE